MKHSQATEAELDGGWTGDARLEQASRLELEGGDAKAIALYREMLHEDPRALEPRLALAALYARRSEHALALEQLDAVRSIDGETVEVQLEVAQNLAAMRRYDDAESELRRAERLSPDRWEVHQQLGILHFKRGLYEDADEELRRAIELDPAQAASYFYRGEALNQMARVDDALEMLERAVQLDPQNARAYFAMGILYDRKHLRAEAAAMYRKARETGAA